MGSIKKRINRNEYITAKELLVVTDDGEKLGVISREQALAEAEKRGLDLVELAPQAKPPVAKIISWSKYKYNLSKKNKNSKNKGNEQKEIWFKSFIGDGDIEHKLKKVEEFIEKKNTVKLTIKRRGRVTRDLMEDLMKKLLDKTSEYSRILNEPKFSGPNYSVVIGPNK